MRLFNTSDQAETRILTRVGVVTVLVVIVGALLGFAVKPFSGRSRDLISVAIETPYVGQGVAVGTPVIMHGVKVGQVVSVSSISGGGVRLQTNLQSGLTHGLTDAIGIDYRPANYFGVTGINVTPAQSGEPLRNGMQLNITPKGNFALQALIYRLGELSNGVFNKRLISVIERATRYADGLTPLLETALIVANSVAVVQTVSTKRLLRNTTGISVAFPGIVDAMISSGNQFLHSIVVDFDSETFKRNWKMWPALSEDQQKRWEDTSKVLEESQRKNDDYYITHVMTPEIDTAKTDLFSRVGKLEETHIADLFPILESVRTLADAVPKIVSPQNFAYTLTELRTRLERMYAGSGDERAMRVRIVLDRLPGVAAPLGLPMGGSP